MNNQIKKDMKSILDNRPELAKEVNKVAEVAGYLWQKGWAERNGGNITVNITEYVDDEIRRMPAISEVKQIGVTHGDEGNCFSHCPESVLLFIIYVWLSCVEFDGARYGAAADGAKRRIAVVAHAALVGRTPYAFKRIAAALKQSDPGLREHVGPF